MLTYKIWIIRKILFSSWFSNPFTHNNLFSTICHSSANASRSSMTKHIWAHNLNLHATGSFITLFEHLRGQALNWFIRAVLWNSEGKKWAQINHNAKPVATLQFQKWRKESIKLFSWAKTGMNTCKIHNDIK